MGLVFYLQDWSSGTVRVAEVDLTTTPGLNPEIAEGSRQLPMALFPTSSP